jgi:hypothetical protein
VGAFGMEGERGQKLGSRRDKLLVFLDGMKEVA